MDSESDQESLIGTTDEEFLSSDSESDNEDECLDDARNWCAVDVTAKLEPPPKFSFTADPGIKVFISDAGDPLEYFHLFFDDNIISHIVDETNRYARNFIETTHMTPSSRTLRWQETDSEEMKKFFALLILQGLVQKPVERWFWSKRPILLTPFFGQVMSSQRYSLLMKFLHFENSETFDANVHPNPKLRKIYDVHQKLNRNFQTVYQPEQEISIDESLLGYKGLLGWKQYIPTKRARFGIKMYQLCESKTGYIWNSLIYTGKGTVFNDKYTIYGLSVKAVMTLIHDLLGCGYTLTTDNFYTCPELAELLIKQKTDLYGTMRANRRGLPQVIRTKKLKKSEMVAFQKGKICVFKWQDKKPLCMLSTIHGTGSADIMHNGNIIKKPVAVLDYNSSMGGVDLSDQCLSYYRITRAQQRKYYKKIFKHLLDQAVWNSFVLFKKKGGNLTHATFRMRLVERLVEDAVDLNQLANRGISVKASENCSRLSGRHFPSYITNSTSNKTHPVRKCVVCASKTNENGKRVRRETRYECEQCNVGLCAAPCFQIYHTVQII